jgi:hypothetical protein
MKILWLEDCLEFVRRIHSLLAMKKFDDAEQERILPIPSTEFVPPSPPKKVPEMKVEASASRAMSAHKVTILRGKASTLPNIPEPPKPTVSPSAQIDGEPHHLLSFGATVYDHRISFVRWSDSRTGEQFEAWCGWDWTLLGPLSEVPIAEGVSSFHLMSSNIDTSAARRFGGRFEMPEHPKLAEGEFAITKGNEESAEALQALTAIRDIYLKHKDRLGEIREAREEYQKAAKAWHAANPPKPENHTFWMKPHRGSRYLEKENKEGEGTR